MPDYCYTGLFLANTSDEIALSYDNGSPPLAHVAYDKATWELQSGASISLDPSCLAPTCNNEPAAWCPATTPYGLGDLGTPGGPNPPCTE